MAIVAAWTVGASAQCGSPDQCDICSLQDRCLDCTHDLPEYWIISSRSAPKCRNLDAGYERLVYKRYDPQCGRFVKESRETFLAEEALLPTLFFVHGNSLDYQGALENIGKFYRRLNCCPGKKRLVGWVWPAEQVYRLRLLQLKQSVKDNLRIKYTYAEHQGYYLAKLVDQMSLSQRVTLSGHSYGGAVVAAALHYLGGGQLHRRVLPGGAPVERYNLRGALIASAGDYDSLYPGQRYGQAFVSAEKVLITRNPHDKTLLKYPEYTSRRGRTALGVSGIDAARLGDMAPKLCQMSTYPEVGRSHYVKPLLANKRFVSAYCCFSFPACSECAAAAAEPTLAVDAAD